MSNLPPEEFMNKKVKIIFEPMITQMLIDKPSDPIPYMLNWLQRISGRNNSLNMEKEELNELRKEVAKLNKKIKKDVEIEIESEEENSENDTENQDTVDDLITERRSILQKKSQRASISAEVYGVFNKKENFIPRVIPKTSEKKQRISDIITQSFIFNSLYDKDLNKVIDAMEEVAFKANQTVVKQGDDGDVLYLVEKGELNCFKSFKTDSELSNEANQVYLKTYGSGEVFGELALLYNAPRAATIIAKNDCVLCSLDRETFNHIVKEASIRKRERYENFLKSVNILSTIDPYEISQIADALKIEKTKEGEYIIKMNEEGDKFFILEEGEAYASKKLERNIYYKLFHNIDDSTEEIVKEYKTGDYFGELALIKNELRAANVIAKTDCKLLTLDRKSFKRLLGPIESLMQKLSISYVGNSK